MKAIDNRVIRRVNYFNTLIAFTVEVEQKAFEIHMRENMDDDIITPIGEIMSACKKLQDYLMNHKPAIK